MFFSMMFKVFPDFFHMFFHGESSRISQPRQAKFLAAHGRTQPNQAVSLGRQRQAWARKVMVMMMFLKNTKITCFKYVYCEK